MKFKTHKFEIIKNALDKNLANFLFDTCYNFNNKIFKAQLF